MTSNINTVTGFLTVTVTVTTTAQGFVDLAGITQEDLDRASSVFLTCNTEALRYTYVEGVIPVSTSVGHYINTGEDVRVQSNFNVNAFQMVRAEAADAEVAVTLEE